MAKTKLEGLVRVLKVQGFRTTTRAAAPARARATARANTELKIQEILERKEAIASTARARYTKSTKPGDKDGIFKSIFSSALILAGIPLYLLLSDKGDAKVWTLSDDGTSVSDSTDLRDVYLSIKEGPTMITFGGIQTTHGESGLTDLMLNDDLGDNEDRTNLEQLSKFIHERMLEDKSIVGEQKMFMITLSSSAAQYIRFGFGLCPKEIDGICEEVLLPLVIDENGQRKSVQDAQNALANITMKGFSYGTKVVNNIGAKFRCELEKLGYSKEEASSITKSVCAINFSPVDSSPQFTTFSFIDCQDRLPGFVLRGTEKELAHGNSSCGYPMMLETNEGNVYFYFDSKEFGKQNNCIFVPHSHDAYLHPLRNESVAKLIATVKGEQGVEALKKGVEFFIGKKGVTLLYDPVVQQSHGMCR